MSFAACLPIILASEGGFVDNPADPGGATNLGITLNALTWWLGHQATIADVEALTPEMVAPIYQGDYWNPAHCPHCPPGVDLMVFDCAVNQGVGRALRTLQAAVGVAADGLFGPATAAAVGAASPATTIERVADVRELFYRSLPTFHVFGVGWLTRVDRTRKLALQMAEAPA